MNTRLPGRAPNHCGLSKEAAQFQLSVHSTACVWCCSLQRKQGQNPDQKAEMHPQLPQLSIILLVKGCEYFKVPEVGDKLLLKTSLLGNFL